MPTTITDNLRNSLIRKTPVYKKTIELSRRLWGGASYAYDTAVDITEYLTEDSSAAIMWKLDKEDYGVFNLDNVTLTFRNERNQWKQDNAKGLFTSGYLLNQSKIIIKVGAQLADGTYETIRVFTGYVSGDPEYNPEDKTVNVTFISAMSLFEKKNAEEISTLVTDELLGEDTGTEFTTANNGVGIIVIVKRGTTLGGATEIKPTTDYTASDTNLTATPLKITLVTGLTAGEKLYISYRYWYQDKTLEWLVEQVMTLCGISSYSISPAIFSTSVENTWDFNSQANWDTCTKVNIDTITTPGSFKVGLVDDFSDGDFSANPTWDAIYGSGWVVDSGKLKKPTGVIAAIKTSYTKTVGNWQFRAWTDPSADGEDFYFIANGSGTVSLPTSGYGIRVTSTVVRLFRINPDTSTTTLLTITHSMSSSDVIRVSRVTGGDFELFINEISKGTVTDNTYTTSDSMQLRAFATGNNYFTDLYFWDDGTTVGTGVLTSTVKDTGGSLSSWGNLTATYTANGATVTIETAVSDDDITYDAWTAIDISGQILSALKQYIKFRVTAVLASLTNPVTPVFDQITVKYYTSTTNISLVNLTGMTCRQVLDLVTQMPAYEMGFKSDDTFVYRSRTTSVPAILDLKNDTNIKAITNLSDGIDRVYNRVVAEFGTYRKVSDASEDTEPNSITKYGTREYSVSNSNLLPAANVNISYAIAPTILAYTKTPRKRCTVETQFIAHLELGDKVTVYFKEDTALRQWKWGDTDVIYGQADIEYYDETYLGQRLNLWGVTMRVEGISLDIQNWVTKYDLVEVLI